MIGANGAAAIRAGLVVTPCAFSITGASGATDVIAGPPSPNLAETFALGVLIGATASLIVALMMRHARARRERELGSTSTLSASARRSLHIRHRVGGLAKEGDEEPTGLETYVPRHMATQLEDVAASYVRGQSISERMRSRARGVRDVLTERLGTDEFEGLPIIERADGTVGDVGTAWWNARLGDSVVSVGPMSSASVPSVDAEAVPPSDELSVPSWVNGAGSGARDVRGTSASGATGRARARAALVARRIAEVDEGLFPVKRNVAELDHDDVWDMALAGMDESIGSYVVPVAPPRSTSAAIDEFEEEATEPLPFKAPAGHPEVVDTETYIDYLISDEFSRNQSDAARASSRNYLRLIEGGSQALRSTDALPRRQRMRRVEYRPRHLAPLNDARMA